MILGQITRLIVGVATMNNSVLCASICNFLIIVKGPKKEPNLVSLTKNFSGHNAEVRFLFCVLFVLFVFCLFCVFFIFNSVFKDNSEVFKRTATGNYYLIRVLQGNKLKPSQKKKKETCNR